MYLCTVPVYLYSLPPRWGGLFYLQELYKIVRPPFNKLRSNLTYLQGLYKIVETPFDLLRSNLTK